MAEPRAPSSEQHRSHSVDTALSLLVAHPLPHDLNVLALGSGQTLDFAISFSHSIGRGGFAQVFLAAGFAKGKRASMCAGSVGRLDQLQRLCTDQEPFAVAKLFGSADAFETELRAVKQCTFDLPETTGMRSRFLCAYIDHKTECVGELVSPVIFYELVSHGTLHELMTSQQAERGGPLPKALIKMILVQICEALCHVHRCGTALS